MAWPVDPLLGVFFGLVIDGFFSGIFAISIGNRGNPQKMNAAEPPMRVVEVTAGWERWQVRAALIRYWGRRSGE